MSNENTNLHKLYSYREEETSLLDINKKISSQQSSIDNFLKKFQAYQPKVNKTGWRKLQQSPYLKLKKYKDSAYYGQIVNGKRHGFGVVIHQNGRLYEGQWQCDTKNGLGYQQFPNGCFFQGSYVNGKPEGLGKYQWPNGQFYEGQWLSGLKHGSGIWHGAKGDSYVGEWKFGKADGQGIHIWINGDRYEGEFKQCLKHGKGTEKFADGDLYKGEFYKGKSQGYGQYFWKNGSFYKGNFKNGKREGFGIWKRNQGNSDKYEGQYVQDKKNGYGIFSWSSGNIYKGNYVNDERQGYGQMYWVDGSYYKGQWKQGAHEGQGIIYTPLDGEKKGFFKKNGLVELIVQQQIKFIAPPKKKKILIKNQPRYYAKSFKKYTSLDLKDQSSQILGKKSFKDKKNSIKNGNLLNEQIQNEKQNKDGIRSLSNSRRKKINKKIESITPIIHYIPQDSVEYHKIQETHEDDTKKMLQTDNRRFKPYSNEQKGKRFNYSTIL